LYGLGTFEVPTHWLQKYEEILKTKRKIDKKLTFVSKMGGFCYVLLWFCKAKVALWHVKSSFFFVNLMQ